MKPKSLLIAFNLADIISILIDSSQAVQQIFFGDNNIIKYKIAIINAVKSKLITTIANENSFYELMRVKIPDLDNKRMWPITFALHNNLCPQDSHISDLRRSSNPKLHSLISVGSNSKRVARVIVSCLCCNTSCITTVVEFGQGKTA